MDKLTMAHEYAKIMLKAFYDGNAHCDNVEVEIASFAFEIADAMQAEANKRAVNGMPEALQDEWQPDWSVAPGGYDWFAIDENGWWHFYQIKPCINDSEWFAVGLFEMNITSSQEYQGDWRNSLRKRPVINKN